MLDLIELYNKSIKDGYTNMRVEYNEKWYDYENTPSHEVVFSGDRLENDVEFERRVKNEQDRIAAYEKSERDQYEELKQKYG